VQRVRARLQPCWKTLLGRSAAPRRNTKGPAAIYKWNLTVGLGTAQRNTAKNKGVGVVAEFLFTAVLLLADELDGLEVL
jgi:hypothetical protein